MNLQEVPKDDHLWTAYYMYETSNLTTALKSERDRKTFAENFETVKPPTLSTICLQKIAEKYKGRRINLNLKPIQLRILYDHIDPHLPLKKCINIVDEYYWKRVYALKCTDKLLLKRKTNQKDVCWKDLVITMKYTEIIENTPCEAWVMEEMEALAKMVSPYVTELKISKLQAMRESSFRKQPLISEGSTISEFMDEGEEEAGIPDMPEIPGIEEEDTTTGSKQESEDEYDYPVEDCHHVDMSIFKHLHNLHSITIEFLPPVLGTNYHSRYFNFSYYDVQNLASGISELLSLKVLKIRRSRMDYVKLSTLVEVLKAMSVEFLELYFCELDDECGESLYDFLIATAALKKLELSGNYFENSAIEYISDGIKSSSSKLTYLGLSNNPIEDVYICGLVDVLLLCDELLHVKLSGINLSQKGSACIARLIKKHPKLRELEIIAVPMDGSALVDAMKSNMILQVLLCQGCGLSLEDEYKIELQVKRNRYIDKNPYIGDSTKTEAEIVAFVSRMKNPVLLNALEQIKSRTDCLKNRSERDEASVAPIVESPVKKRKEIKFRNERYTDEELCKRIVLFSQKKENFFKHTNAEEISNR